MEELFKTELRFEKSGAVKYQPETPTAAVVISRYWNWVNDGAARWTGVDFFCPRRTFETVWFDEVGATM